jgi:phosphatidylethanolamine/phosphatidyl-N-methylethanolamine N-methyltransferase
MAKIAGAALFLSRWVRNPLRTGGVPSSRHLARAMALATLEEIRGRDGAVVELGAGEGAITRGLLREGLPVERLVSVELDAVLTRHLRRAHPGLTAIAGDATRLSALLAEHDVTRVAAVVSSLPLLSLPDRVVQGVLRSVFEVLPPGAAMIQFTYGGASPIPTPLAQELGLASSRGERVWRNVPPAAVWRFRRPVA